MTPPPKDQVPLVYIQDDDVVCTLGEPIPITARARITVVKWDGFYADALARACETVFPLSTVSVYRAAQPALERLRDRPADLVLLGLTFPDLDGVDVLQTLARDRLARRVMIVSGRKDEHSLQTLRAARFDAFFDPYAEKGDSLVHALEHLAAGRGYVTPSLLRRIGEQRTSGVVRLRLTLAELQVLAVIGDGSDDAEAACRLGLTVATVATHRRNLMRKLGVSTSAKLVREAIRLGVVRIDADGRIIRPGYDQLQAQRDARRNDRI